MESWGDVSGEGAVRVGFEGMSQDGEGAGQVGFRQHVGQAHFVAAEPGGGVEARCGSHEYGFSLEAEFAQTPLAEKVGIVDR